VRYDSEPVLYIHLKVVLGPFLPHQPHDSDPTQDIFHSILSLILSMIMIYSLTTGGFSGTSVGLILQHLPFSPQQI
jgi:hypothetical protein